MSCIPMPDPASTLLKRRAAQRGAILAAFAVALLGGGARGQGSGPFIQHEPRAMTRVVYFNASGAQNGNPIAGEYAIEYGKPTWQRAYDADFAKLTRGQRHRLGKDWWTTLDTFVPLGFGEKTELKAGEYFLALECSDKGDWSLIALDPEPLKKSKVDAFGSSQTKGGTKIPLAYETTADEAKELSIQFLGDDQKPREQVLEIRFGKHRLTTVVKPKV
jgi:hypothetical protein